MNENSNNNNSFNDGGDVAHVCSRERGLYVVEMAGHQCFAENDYNKDSNAYLAAKREKFKQISKYNKKQR